MTVLFFCWEYPPQGSGIGRYVAEMSSALQNDGHYIVVVTSRSPNTPERETLNSGMVYRLFERTELRSHKVAKLVLGIARCHKVDWIEGADHWGECATLLQSRNRPPVVVKMHYNDVLRVSRYAQAWYPWQRTMIDLACLRQWRSLRGERYSMEKADVLTACCQRSLIEVRAQGILLPEKTAVIPNPIRLIPTWTNAEAPRPTLLLVGRLDMGKGLPYVRPLLDALLPMFPDLVLEIAGGDSYARGIGSIRDWILRQLGPVRDHVHLLGVMNREALDAAYRRAWVVIVLSRWDTFPQVVLESMARGKPIVASPHGGMPEMLDSVDGAIANPASLSFSETVSNLLKDSKKRINMGNQLQVRAKSYYSPERIAKQYIDTISSLLIPAQT